MEHDIENSKLSIEFHESPGDLRSIHDPFLSNQHTSSEANDAFLPKSSRSHTDEAADGLETKATLRRLLKGKEKEWASISASREGPLRLLDLPVDVLKDIVKEVTHTNDLASLALTNSALHNLAIPHIYGRFDIVWPDAHNSAEPRTGVDALTYGLATLVMGGEVFGNAQPHMNDKDREYCQSCMCDHCQSVKSEAAAGVQPVKKYRRGNYFARFTKKFSLGNGPPDWVQEYLITKEAGKMLGTLVALSVARMPNLETFIWDMPTGILRDIWISLASLGDRGNSKLEKLWIRFHDNRETFCEGPSHPTAAPQPIQNQLGATPTASTLQPSQDLASTPVATLLGNSYHRTEHPNFSILSPLKSLSVLDIDEPAYLDEISVLIGKSIRTLRELRIGIAPIALVSGWASFDSVGASSEDANGDNATIAAGGVFGLMMSKIYNPYLGDRPNRSLLPSLDLLSPRTVISDLEAQPGSSTIASEGLSNPSQSLLASHGLNSVPVPPESEGSLSNSSSTSNESDLAKPPLPSSAQSSSSKFPPPQEQADDPRQSNSVQPENSRNEYATTQNILPSEAFKPRKLQLEVLELERIKIDIKIIQESINWSIITSLTLLQCELHEELWKALRTRYVPHSTSFSTSPSKSKQLLQSNSPSDYKLNLKRIHTDTVSLALITFLKETLAPDSLEWMFFQDGRGYKSSVTVETIFRGPVKRHRGSLTKVMIDSAIGKPDNARNSKRKKWIVKREFLAFITSGKMNCLKELAMSVEYKDWHFFVQRLPQVPQLRSLYVPYIADHVYGNQLNPKELALQLVDIVSIRHEIEICYMAFATTCFELLENRNRDGSSWSRFDTSTAPAHAGPGGVDDSDDDEANNEGDDDASNPDAPVDPATEDPEDSESDSDSSSIGGSDGYMSESERKRPVFKLREILFYDDKVSIFKARHGQL